MDGDLVKDATHACMHAHRWVKQLLSEESKLHMLWHVGTWSMRSFMPMLFGALYSL